LILEGGPMFKVERKENARWMRAQAEQFRRSAGSASEPGLRYSYIELAESYEARAHDFDVATPTDLYALRGYSAQGNVPGPLG
jgi:hypothetical protein